MEKKYHDALIHGNSNHMWTGHYFRLSFWNRLKLLFTGCVLVNFKSDINIKGIEPTASRILPNAQIGISVEDYPI